MRCRQGVDVDHYGNSHTGYRFSNACGKDKTCILRQRWFAFQQTSALYLVQDSVTANRSWLRVLRIWGCKRSHLLCVWTITQISTAHNARKIKQHQCAMHKTGYVFAEWCDWRFPWCALRWANQSRRNGTNQASPDSLRVAADSVGITIQPQGSRNCAAQRELLNKPWLDRKYCTIAWTLCDGALIEKRRWGKLGADADHGRSTRKGSSPHLLQQWYSRTSYSWTYTN